MKYRTEILFGDNYRDAAKVMAHETFELENTDILSTLRTTILKESPISDKLRILEEEVESGDISSDDNGELYKVLQAHTVQEAWTPTNAPSLFAKVLIDPKYEPNGIPQGIISSGYFFIYLIYLLNKCILLLLLLKLLHCTKMEAGL